VRLIDPEGKQLGVLTLDEARELARERDLDLVEVNPNTRPIVCRIMNWGKYRYEESKKARATRKKDAAQVIKQVKYRPNIDDHDFATKTSRARGFLEKGHKVKATIMFRSREMRRKENGVELLDRIAEDLSDVAVVESRPGVIIHRDLTMILAPRAT
jgi:translation initiation factor IF-3